MLDLKRLRILREVAQPGLVLGRRRRALPLPVGGQPAGRDPRARGRHAAARAHPRGPEADRRRPGAGRATPRRRSPGSRRPSASWPRSPGSRAASCGWRASRAPARPSSPRRSRSSTGRHPKVRLSVADAEPEESLPRLRAGELDLALTFDYPSVPEARGARPRPDAAADRVDAPGAADGPPARRAQQVVPLAELARDRVAVRLAPEHLRRGRHRRLPRRRLRAAGSASRPTTTTCMQGFIAAGLGVTLLPDLALPTLRSDLVVRPTDPPAPERRVWAATRAEGARSPATEEMVAILAEVGAAFAKRTARAAAGRLARSPGLGRAVGRDRRLGDPRMPVLRRRACGSTRAPPGAGPRSRPRTTSARGRRGCPRRSPGAGAGCRPRCG